MEKAAAEAAAKQVADKQAVDAEGKKVAALSPPPSSPLRGKISPRSVQARAAPRRLHEGRADSEWSETAQRSLTLFNKYAGTKF